MDLSSVRSTLDDFLDYADEMDRNSRGMKTITNGTHSTRDTLLKELGIFLLNIADEYFFINSDQAEMLDMIMNKGFTYAPSDKIKQVAASIDKQKPDDNVSLNAYVLSDAMLSYHTGRPVSSGVENMIGIYKLIGMNFVVAGGYQNTAAMNRINSFTEGLERRVPALKEHYSKMVAGAAEDAGIKPPPTVSEDGILHFNDDIELVVPDGYIHETVTGENDLDRTEWIRYGEMTDDDGNVTYEFNASFNRIDYTPGEDDDRAPGEAPFDVLRRRVGENGKYLPFGKNMALSVKKPLRLFGALMKYKQLVLAAEVDDNTIAALQSLYIQDDDNPELDKNAVRHLMKLFGGMKIKGRKCSLTGLDEKKFLKIAHCDFDEDNDESIADLKVGLKISVNGGEEVDAGEISVSQKPKKANDAELPEPRELWDSYHDHLTLVTSGRYTTHRDADFRGQSIRGLMEECGAQREKAYKLMEIPGDDWDLDQTALKLAKVFRMDESLFDPYNDTEALIRKGMIKNVRALHALRSLAWAVTKMTRYTKDGPGGLSYEKLEEIAEKILEKDYLYYDMSCACGLCAHYDWHVFYVPDKYRESDTAMNHNLQYLTGKENRGGNSFSIFIPGVTGFDNSISNIISRNEETLESLEDLRSDLVMIRPVMETIHDELLAGRDRSEPLEGVLAEALAAWCALAVAAKEPFYSEEAADTPEANAGLEGPLERPTDQLDDQPVGKSKPAAKKLPKAAAKPAVPAGEMLDLNGATVIEPGQFAGNMSLHRVVIPEGVTEIGERAFYSCMYLESVTFPKSLRKIDRYAFMSCRALNRVDLQEGVEELGTHVFGATNSLKEVRLPDSLKKVDRTVFGMGGDSPYATAYLSGDLACRLKNEESFGDPLYARHYVIDGVGYESMSDFYAAVKSGKVTPKTLPVKKTEAAVQAAPKAAAGKASEAKKAETKAAPGAKPTTAKKAETKATPAAKAPAKTAAKTAGTKKTAAKAAPGEITLDLGGSRVIAENQFSGYKDAAKVIIPEGITEIGAWAFNNALVEEFVLPKSLKKIGQFAFYQNKQLKSVEIQDGLEMIGQAAFQSCPNLKDLYIPDSIKQIDGTAVAQQNGGSKGPMIHLSGTLARRIYGNRKYQYSDGLSGRRFEIEGDYFDSLRKYMEYWEKNEATEAHFANKAGGSGYTAPKPAPAASSGTRVLSLGGKTVIENSAYMGDSDTRPLVIPEGVTKVSANAFMMAKTESVTLPASMRILEHHAFAYCPNLKKIEIKDGLVEIESLLIPNSPNLTDIYLPDSIRKVNVSSFIVEAGKDQSLVTVHLSGKLARYLEQHKEYSALPAVRAKGFVIEGRWYISIEDYVKKSAAERAAQAERERQERARKEEEERKRRERNALTQRIQALEKERDGLTGLFAAFKRRKLQNEIDELKEKMRRL